MSYLLIPDHEHRADLSNELHARPFPRVMAPARVAAVAMTRDANDPGAHRRHLCALLDHYNLPHPAPKAQQFQSDLPGAQLRWEQHSEFVTYTLIADGLDPTPFSGQLFETLPRDWQNAAPGPVISSVLIHVQQAPDFETAQTQATTLARDWFVEDSVAVSTILDGAAVICGDFRLDPAGHIRFGLVRVGDTGPQRLGRIVARLIEIECYKTLALKTLPIARKLLISLRDCEEALETIVSDMTHPDSTDAQTLDRLLQLSAVIEGKMAKTRYRFSASDAYGRIVHERIRVFRETRFLGYQLFAEVMGRQFDPAMRTCRAAEARLEALSRRAARAAELLGTQVSVDATQASRKLLTQMDNRAALQLRLQETVEGLSVVAISYYAVNLASKLLAPFAQSVGIAEKWLTAGLVPLVLLLVWLAVRRIRNHLT